MVLLSYSSTSNECFETVFRTSEAVFIDERRGSSLVGRGRMSDGRRSIKVGRG